MKGWANGDGGEVSPTPSQLLCHTDGILWPALNVRDGREVGVPYRQFCKGKVCILLSTKEVCPPSGDFSLSITNQRASHPVTQNLHHQVPRQ
jgi:hypothetical protein